MLQGHSQRQPKKASDNDDDDAKKDDVDSDIEMEADPVSAGESSSEVADDDDGETPDGEDTADAGSKKMQRRAPILRQSASRAVRAAR